MSEPKLISPMLDNFVMGGPISDHHGVRCCPAMRKDSDSKYIVKIISVPASQVQLQALLLTGAYKNEAAALSYFQELSQGIVQETGVLEKLSRLEGFHAFDACQIVPMENAVGYDVYLLSPYRHSLERFFRKNTMTHLGAVNLGLDMCASLAVCRQAGYLYADLKPSNIYISRDQEYRIGDLGFLKLDSLKFASMPEKYLSAYTAPEIKDAYSSVNTTIGIYAAGMILYQAYNGGVLPFAGRAPSEALAAPIYADYEMAEIILKAIDPDPQLRWQDPIQMGQALVSYMQRNGANDTPIVPPAVGMPEGETEPALKTVSGSSAELSNAPEAASSEDDPANLSFMDTLTADDTAPSEETATGVTYQELSSDASDILAHADDLIAHETPEPAVAPDPIDIPMPPPIVLAPDVPVVDTLDAGDMQVDASCEKASMEHPSSVAVAPAIEEDYDDEYDDYDGSYADKKAGKRIAVIILVALLLAGLAFGGYLFFKNYYLQNISSLTLEVVEDQLRVNVTTDVDHDLLTVVCTDTYGNKLTAPVVDGVAVFTGLNPNTLYSVKVEISGLHKLTGDVTDGFTTPVQTNIVNFSAVTGNTAGSAILSFTVDGMDSESWSVTYSAEGEAEKTETFTGHMVSISGLTVGKTYTFRLKPQDELYIVGAEQVEYTASEPVYAEDLNFTGATGNSISVAWKAPAQSQVTSWIVRCYNNAGYDQTITTSDTSATFTGVDPKVAHTVDVTAEGMSAGKRCYMTANATTVTDAAATVTGPTSISVSWKSEQAMKWVVMYTVDGSAQQGMVRTDTTSAVISPIVPGATYSIQIQVEDGTTVFGGSITLQTPAAKAFEGYLVTAANMTFRMCRTPNVANWTHANVAAGDYTDSFKVGEKASFVVNMSRSYNMSNDIITTMYVIRDASGRLISSETSSQTWTSMWYRRYCELDVPTIPTEPGEYTIEIFFNGASAHNQVFQIVAAN
ncbi:MAG: fibronectin type III domain-containing protein [Oscillospiraceae bacterium]|nr:fibronectin type III domain-containing protein [Oscillospiraceae bacterium]